VKGREKEEKGKKRRKGRRKEGERKRRKEKGKRREVPWNRTTRSRTPAGTL
jgi:hypothetical protein